MRLRSGLDSMVYLCPHSHFQCLTDASGGKLSREFRMLHLNFCQKICWTIPRLPTSQLCCPNPTCWINFIYLLLKEKKIIKLCTSPCMSTLMYREIGPSLVFLPDAVHSLLRKITLFHYVHTSFKLAGIKSSFKHLTLTHLRNSQCSFSCISVHLCSWCDFCAFLIFEAHVDTSSRTALWNISYLLGWTTAMSWCHYNRCSSKSINKLQLV